MSNAIVSNAKNTHYAVSTFAAVVYGLVWLLANRAHAETPVAAAMPEVLVTAKREIPQTEIPEVIVWGKRETAAPTAMEEIVVTAKRESANDARIAAVSGASAVTTKASAGWFSQARQWVRSTLLKYVG